MNPEISEKTERLKKMLAENNLGGVLLNSQHNFAWITAGASNGIDLSRENGAATILIRRDGKKFILASRIEMPRILAEGLSENEFEPIDFAWEDEKASPTFLFDLTASVLSEEKSLGSDLFLSPKFPVIESHIARCRYQLTDQEIGRFRALGSDAGIAVGELIKILTPGESENEIARKTVNALAAKGIHSVVTLIGADERILKYRHPIPTDNVWKKFLLIVVCAKRQGLIASLSRIICLGEIPDELKNKTEDCDYVFAKILSETKQGKTGAELYRTAANAYAEKGFADEIHKHHQGGAAGYKTRDWVIHPQSQETVFSNQAFAFNPSITGTKTEETALLINDEIEIITATPDFPQLSVKVNGKDFYAPDILSL